MNNLIEKRVSPVEDIANGNRAIVLLLRRITNNLIGDVAEIREEVAEIREDLDELIDDVRILKRSHKLIIDLLIKMNANIEDIKEKSK